LVAQAFQPVQAQANTKLLSKKYFACKGTACRAQAQAKACGYIYITSMTAT
jgi:hypothetical protein